ncbi:hypothetical protein GH714_000036 [Hevea brasiliensis]|uniref:Uncharacterized protein n=1 Tax=Hevea brasiliensis TaxID=3981 RepID=A0A6A6KTV6_HEVBR|nr:hypothetical protein GH714_000036 [Hevea brasiliensis]
MIVANQTLSHLLSCSLAPFLHTLLAKSDDTSWSHHLRFYSTPQMGPTYNSASTASGFATSATCKAKPARFSRLSNMFRSRSEKFNPDPSVSGRGVPSRTSCEASSSSPPGTVVEEDTSSTSSDEEREAGKRHKRIGISVLFEPSAEGPLTGTGTRKADCHPIWDSPGGEGSREASSVRGGVILREPSRKLCDFGRVRHNR